MSENSCVSWTKSWLVTTSYSNSNDINSKNNINNNFNNNNNNNNNKSPPNFFQRRIKIYCLAQIIVWHWRRNLVSSFYPACPDQLIVFWSTPDYSEIPGIISRKEPQISWAGCILIKPVEIPDFTAIMMRTISFRSNPGLQSPLNTTCLIFSPSSRGLLGTILIFCSSSLSFKLLASSFQITKIINRYSVGFINLSVVFYKTVGLAQTCF